MHPITQQLYEYLENVIDNKATLSDDIIEEFGERVKKALREKLNETQEDKFRLRMSNIGKPLRQLMLEKEYGRDKATPDFMLKMLFGSLYEALVIALLKGAKVGLTEHDKEVALAVAGIEISGTLDVIINNKVYDVKTASPYSFEKKFNSWEELHKSDDFGYFAQGFGYAKACGKRFGGWIVINKVTGQIKVVEIPDDIHNDISATSISEIAQKVKHLLANLPMPKCEGEIEETFYKKPTGNRILSGSCTFCRHKDKCHPNIKYLPSKASKSENPKFVYYTHIKDEDAS